ncbi:MAG: rhodanese-like domain-containing protein [Actinomycetota bacterium]|nr:rhodanese-like domain-containing protein [Actinomycetota bacterium]
MGGGTASVGPEQAHELQRKGAVLLDVREHSEWSAGRAPNAIHIPLGQLPAKAGQLRPGAHVVTVCRSGRRSARAASMLTRQGYQVTNVRDGMTAWQAAGLPVVAGGGHPGRIA